MGGATPIIVSATGLPRPIPDVGSVDSVLDLGAIEGDVIEDVVIVIDAIDHGFVPDLSVDLESRST